MSLFMYGVFIIESLRAEDYPDGQRLNEILELSLIPVRYRWVDNPRSFKSALTDFRLSKYRYLHLSCHADLDGIEINGNLIDNYQLVNFFRGNAKGRRLFVSACQASNLHMATAFINRCGGQSVIGSPRDLRFDKAALFWPTFYHVINEADETRMNRSTLTAALKKCVSLFKVPINYYHSTSSRKSLFRHKIRTTGLNSLRIRESELV